MKVMVRNGRVGTLVGNCSVIFDNYDGYSYSVPANDIVKVWNDKEFKGFMEEVNKTAKEDTKESLEEYNIRASEDFENDMNSNLEGI